MAGCAQEQVLHPNQTVQYGKVNEHKATIPRDFRLNEWGGETVIWFCADKPP
jgi:hypothetical protein